MIPLADCKWARRVNTSEVTVDRDTRRAGEVHHHLRRTLLFAPTDDGAVHALGAKPRACRHRPQTFRIGRDVVAGEHALSAGKVTRRAHDALRRGCAFIARGHTTRVVGDGIVHVPHAAEAVAFVEHSLAIGRARRISVAPVDAQRLPRVSFDPWDAHPDRRRAVGRAPLFDPVRERCSVVR